MSTHLAATPDTRPTDPFCRATSLPITSLRWHEATEPARLTALVGRLGREPQRKPIHVVQVDGSHLIVDGAHRARALCMLGHENVRAHEMRIDPTRAVPGWTHVVSERAGPQLMMLLARQALQPGGRPVAQVSGPHGTAIMWAPGIRPGDLARSVHEVAGTYQRDPYVRHPPNVVLPSGRTAVTWVLPTWGELCRLVAEHGPLPAGVTRLGGIIEAGCRPSASRQRRSAA